MTILDASVPQDAQAYTGANLPTVAPKRKVLASPGSPFTATNNLIGNQIGPSSSPATQQASGFAQTAAQNYAGATPKPFTSISQINPAGAASQFATANTQAQGQQAFGYTPVAGTQTAGTRSILGQLGGQTGAGGVGSFGYGTDTTGVRGQAVGQLNTLLNTTPDRAKLNADTYDLMQERDAPRQQLEDRRLAQQTAALGRAKSGMFNSNQTDLATQRETTRDQARRELATNAAQQSLADQQAKLGAAQGLAGDMSQWDLGSGSLNQGYNRMALDEAGNAFGRTLDLADREYGMARDVRSDALGERDAGRTAALDRNDVLRSQSDASRRFGLDQYGLQTDAYGRDVGERDAGVAYDQAQFGNQRNQFRDLADYEGMRRGYDASDRGELRGERDYQYGLSRDALGDRIGRYGLEQGGQQQDFENSMQGLGFGYGTNPAGAYGAAGAQAGQQASDAQTAAADLMAQYGRRRRPAGRGAAPTEPPPEMGY